MFFATLNVILLLVPIGYAFDEMFIEASDVSYQQNLLAATKLHSHDFDEGLKILGFPSDDIEFDGIVGKVQYDVAMFRGIKYATAERFGKPKIVQIPKNEKLYALEAGPSCPQPSQDYIDNPGDYTEDCLFLDVYVPLRKTIVAFRRSNGHHEWGTRNRYTQYRDLPIIIAFQGEDFTYVESRVVNGRVLARYGSAIVVVINYRTGVLGFLSSGDDKIKGNFGLADQKVAIEWVKENAKRFGGDASSITLLGYSSGAESVAAQMYDPTNSKHLFRRVVLQSGIVQQGRPFANNKTEELAIQKHLFSKMSEYLECHGDKVRCIKSAKIKDLVIASGALTYERGNNRTFGPIEDDRYSCDLVDLSQYDVMIGFVEFEAGNNVEDLPESEPLSKSIKRILSQHKEFSSPSENLIRYLEQEYSSFPEISSGNKRPYGFVRAASDFEYIVPAIYFANKVSSLGAKTYMYRFSPQINSLQPGKPYFIEDRAVHGEDQKYVFGLPLLLVQLFKESDRNISANYIRMISNFAHTGDPDVGPTNRLHALPPWVQYDKSNMGTYDISATMEMKYNMFVKPMAIWTESVPYLLRNKICENATKPVETEKKILGAVACPESCNRQSSWEATYAEWKKIELPKWRESFNKAKETLDRKDGCNQ